jgi:hypothetical protein
MSEVITTVFMPDTPLDCGHATPEHTSGIANGVAIDLVTNKTMCYSCADALHLNELLSAPVGASLSAYVRLPKPHGYSQLPPGVVGEVTSWSGGLLGRIVPGTLNFQRGTGFGGSRTSRIHFRALIHDGQRQALYYGTGAGDGMLATLKRMIDRPNPSGDAPHPTTKAGRKVRGR